MKKLLAACGALAVLAPAHAVAQDIPFQGTVSTSCTITVPGSPIALTQNADATELAGSGTVSVSANALFSASVSDPTGWATAPAGAPATSFAATINGGTAPVAIDNATSDITVGLTATSGAGSFVNGTYDADVTVTCS